MYRFAAFQVDPREHELRRDGVRVKIQEQSLIVLLKLLAHPGKLVSRQDLSKALWPADTFVDFDTGLNKVIKQLRATLGDPAEAPTFIETVPKLGYRFIATVEFFDEERPAKYTARPKYSVPVKVGAVVITVGALAIWMTTLQALSVPTVLRFTRLTNDGQAKTGTIATDGSRIFLNELLPGPRNLITQVSVTGGETVPLSVPLRQAEMLDISRDGTELLISSSEGDQGRSLWVLPVAGGSPRRIGTILVDGDARFGADGTKIIYGIRQGIYSVNQDGSVSRKLLAIDSNNYPYSFRISPDARVFRFSQIAEEYEDQIDSATLMEAAADGAGVHRMFPGCCGRWTPDARFFIFTKNVDGRSDLWALPELKRLPWQNRDTAPFPLTAGPLNFHSPLPSKDGSRVFAIGDSPRAELVRYDSHSRQFVPYLSGISAEGLAFSRDGQWVAYASYPDGTLWRSRVDGSQRRQLTFPPMRILLPRWSPDGRQIAFNAILPGVPWNVYVVLTEGGTPQRILPSEHSQMDANWSPDGHSLVFGTFGVPNTPISNFDVESKRVSTLPGSMGLFSPRWSPDGKYIAAMTTEHPSKLMVFELATQKWTEVFGLDMGYPSWSRDASYIYFVDAHSPGTDDSLRIVRLRLRDRKIENIVDFKKVGRLAAGTIVTWFGLAPDDSPLFARDISMQEIYALEVKWPLH
jgi:Tol biopolymer transport system component/DNA-binding winged helix-turn-helix (wHTH) protein